MDNVWGKIFSLTKNTFALFLTRARGRELKNINMASAAAVPSSRSDEFAIGIAVRSDTIVWKFKSASNLPCDISA